MIDLYKNCTLCPRRCNVNRFENKGFCGEGANLYVARAALHEWEEPCISADNGSGTVFFRGCSLKCVYCQNFSIAHNRGGKEITTSALAEAMLSLQEKGAHNINFVTPTHFVPHIIDGVNTARKQGLSIPIVYNTSGYETPETIKLLSGIADIFLSDFKYITPQTAQKYSFAPNYPEYAKSALEEMVKISPAPIMDNGVMQKGVIVRVLLLPDHLIEAKMIVKYLYSTYKDNIVISLMNQYTPIKEHAYPNLNRRVTDYEYKSLVDYAASLGVTNAFIQKGDTAKESFIPAFDLTGI